MRIRLALFPVLALAALLSTLAVAGPAASVAQAKPAVGIADQELRTLQDPRYQKANIKKLRIAVSYDQIRRGGKRLAQQDEYFRLAKQLKKDVRVAWYRTSSCSPGCAAKRLPSVSELRTAFRAFRARYPQIKKFSTWNEMDFPLAQPTGRNPKRAADFYKMMKKECRKSYKGAPKCSVLAGDFRANGSKFSAKFFKTFRARIGGGSHQWGLISYPDVIKNSNKYTKKFLKDTKRGNVYVNEVGAFNSYGRFYKPSLSRQSKTMKYLLTRYVKTSSRIKELYVYQWQAGNRAFDSGLLNSNGTPRPAYFTFFKYLKKKAPTQ